MRDFTNIATENLLEEMVQCVDKDPDACPPELISEVIHRISDEYLTAADQVIQKEGIQAQRSAIIDLVLKEDTIIMVGFSGGKDSIAMYLKLLELGVDPKRIELHHQEVDGKGEQLFDWKTTTEYCQAFADHFGSPIYYSYRKGGIVNEALKGLSGPELSQDNYWQEEPGGSFTTKSFEGDPDKRMKFPASVADLQARWCSYYVKISVMRQMLGNTPRLDGKTIVVCTGERREESGNRAKYPEIESYRNGVGARGSKNKKILAWRPVIDLKETEVWDLIKKHKIQPHPAYMLGWDRCSCQTCIFNSSNIWATINEINPEKIQRLTQMENTMNFAMFSDKDKNPVTLLEKMAKGASLIEPGDQYWIDQGTKKWDAPIIVENWVMPKGAFSKENCGAN